MALCKDPSLTYLNSNSYNVVRLPRQGIEPLDVLGRDDAGINRLGPINAVWTSPNPVPMPGPPQPAAGIAGTKTGDLKLSLGLSLLSNILNGMGAIVDLPKLNLAHQRARKLQYTFGDVVSVSIEPFALGDYLESGDLKHNNPFVNRYFDEEGTSAYVISEVLKSDTVTVSAKDDNGLSVSVDLPAIQQLVGAKVSVTSNRTDASELSYKGSAQLTFGFKAFGIMFADGKWSVQGLKASGALAFALPGEDQLSLQPILLGKDHMLRLNELSRAASPR